MNLLYPLFVHCYLDLISRNGASEQGSFAFLFSFVPLVYLYVLVDNTHTAKAFMEKFKKDFEPLYGEELQKIAAVTSLDHIKENDLVRNFRSSLSSFFTIVILRICWYPLYMILYFTFYHMKFHI